MMSADSMAPHFIDELLTLLTGKISKYSFPSTVITEFSLVV